MSATSNEQRAGESGSRQPSLRDDLALALDGELPDDPAAAAIAYEAAAALLADRLEPGLSMLRDGSCGRIALLGSRYDEIRLFGGQLGIELNACDDVREVPADARVVFAGCQRSPAVGEAITRWLDDGAIVVTSDKSAGLASIAPLLGAGEPVGPRRARLIVDAGRPARGGLDLESMPVLPAVRLSPGHVPIAPRTLNDGVVTLARDALTGDPLAVAMPISNGFLIHSVPHWWQCERAGQTAVERRPIEEIPDLAWIDREGRGLTLGGFIAAAAMLLTLANGLAAALGQPLDAQSRVW